MPMVLFHDGNLDRNIEYAETYGLNFPILSDIDFEVFNRWNPTMQTPSTTFISRTQWYTAPSKHGTPIL